LDITTATAAPNASIWTAANLTLRDSNSFAQNRGGSIIFEGKFTTAGSYSTYGFIRGGKQNTTDGSSTGNLLYGARGGDHIFVSSGSGLTDGTSEKLRINSSGNVGIGTSSPSYKLEVDGSFKSGNIETSGQGVTFSRSDGNSFGVRMIADSASSGFVFRADTYNFFDQDASTQFATILNNGNVGIGTVSPSRKLSVSTSESSAVQFTSNPPGSPTTLDQSQFAAFSRTSSLNGLTFASTDPRLLTGTITSNNEVVWRANKLGLLSTDYLTFKPGGGNSEAMRIDSSGRLLVGTPSAFTSVGQVPKFFLATTNAVDGGIGIGQFGSTNYGAHFDLIRSNSGTIGQATDGAIPNNNTIGNIRFIGSDGVNFRQGAGIIAMADQLWTSDDCPTRLVFSTTADGASGPTERMRIDSAGKIGFSDYPRDGNNVRFANSITGATNMDSVVNIGVIQTDATGSVNGFKTYLSSINGTRTTNEINHFAALKGTYGTGHTVTSQRGYFAHSGLTGATNNYGFYSDIASGSGRWNFYANGTAHNYFAGTTLFGENNTATITSGAGDGAYVSVSGVRNSSRSSTSSSGHQFFYNPNGAVGSIVTSGSATAYNTSSDYRLKENVVDLTGAIDRVNQLQVRRFNFIADPDTTVDGFIAHEAQAVVPESVTGTKDEMEDIGTLTEWDGTVIETDVIEPNSLTWEETITDEDGNETVETRTRTWVKTGDRPVMQGIDQSKLVPLLTAALQEALAKIETLEQRLNDAGIA
jgi:hypothetical protein